MQLSSHQWHSSAHAMEFQSDQCHRYYRRLADTYNLNLQTELRMFPELPKWPDPHYFSGGGRCEADILWDGKRLNEKKTSSRGYVHPLVVSNLRELLQRISPRAFRGTLYTPDNSMCVPRHHSLVEHSQSPLKETTLLPIHANQMAFVRAKTQLARRKLTTKGCAWYGSNTGHAEIQHTLNVNRTRCKSHMNDRSCVVAMGLPNVSFGNSVRYGSFDCMLAIDGNSYAGSFKTSLAKGQLVVRVGGFRNHQRLSSYEWFEPYLRDREHYIQTTIDNLRATLREIEDMPLAELQRIAENGHRAFVALVNNRSIACHVHLVIARSNRVGMLQKPGAGTHGVNKDGSAKSVVTATDIRDNMPAPPMTEKTGKWAAEISSNVTGALVASGRACPDRYIDTAAFFAHIEATSIGSQQESVVPAVVLGISADTFLPRDHPPSSVQCSGCTVHICRPPAKSCNHVDAYISMGDLWDTKFGGWPPKREVVRVMWKQGNGAQYPWEWFGQPPDMTMGYRAPMASDRNIVSKALPRGSNRTFQPDDHVFVSMLAGLSISMPVSYASFKYPPGPGHCKQAGVVTFMSNCIGLRMRAMKVLQRHLPVTVFGKCAKHFGTEDTLAQRHPECRSAVIRKLMPEHLSDAQVTKFSMYYEKACVYRSYHFAFTFENAVDFSYVSEKPYHALLAGTVPIYWGAPNARSILPAQSAVIVDAVKGKNMSTVMDEVGRHLKSLGHDMRQYVAWKEEPPTDNFAQTLSRQESGAYCRVCQAIARKKTRILRAG